METKTLQTLPPDPKSMEQAIHNNSTNNTQLTLLLVKIRYKINK